MANNIITPRKLTMETLAHLENELNICQHISTDFSEEFTAVGDTIDVRRPVRFLGQSDNLDVTSYKEDINEGKVPLQMNRTETIHFSIDPLDATLSIYSPRIFDRYIKPAVTKFKDAIEVEAGKQYYKFWNFTGTPGTVPATFKALGEGGVKLTNGAVPMDDRFAFHNPTTSLELADGLKNVYVQDKAKKAFERMKIGFYAGFENYQSVHVPVHVVGAHGGTPLVNGAAQNVTYTGTARDGNYQTLITDGWTNSTTGILKKGDVFTIAGVYSVNPISKVSTGVLQDFTVLADADSGATTGPATLTIAPAIITSGAYQTVSAAPADNAAITVKTGTAGSSRPQSLLMHKDAMTLITRPLKIPKSSFKTTTISGNKMSISLSESGDFNTLSHNYRLDMLFKVEALYPDLGCRLTA